jgi:hypothetical protein
MNGRSQRPFQIADGAYSIDLQRCSAARGAKTRLGNMLPTEGTDRWHDVLDAILASLA